MAARQRQAEVGMAELEQAEWNPRRVSPEQLRRLRESLYVFGDLSGIVWNEVTGKIICGHQRRKALEEFKVDKIDWSEPYRVTLGQRGKRFAAQEQSGQLRLADGARINIRRVAWREPAFEKAANVAANNPELQGEWSEDLQGLLQEINESLGEDAEELGFEALFDKLFGAMEIEQEGKTDPDEAPPLPEATNSEPGKIYRLGEHRIGCADCTAEENLHRLLGGKQVDMVFTDPPYNMKYNSKALGGIMNDALSEAAFVRLILASTRAILTALRPGAAYYICMSSMEYPTVAAQLRKHGLQHRLLVWIKPGIGLGAQEYRPQYELILYGATGTRAERVWNGGRRESDLWEFDARRGVLARESGDGQTVIEFGAGVETVQVVLEGKSRGRIISFEGEVEDLWHCPRENAGHYVHPTQKPVALAERALLNSSLPGQTVFDPFLGSGTTVIAAQKTGRRCLGFELDPRYLDVTRQRWAEHVHGRGCDWQRLTKEA